MCISINTWSTSCCRDDFCTSFKEYRVSTTERDTDFPFSLPFAAAMLFCSQLPFLTSLVSQHQTHHPKLLVTHHTRPPLFELIGWLAVCPFCREEKPCRPTAQRQQGATFPFLCVSRGHFDQCNLQSVS